MVPRSDSPFPRVLRYVSEGTPSNEDAALTSRERESRKADAAAALGLNFLFDSGVEVLVFLCDWSLF